MCELIHEVDIEKYADICYPIADSIRKIFEDAYIPISVDKNVNMFHAEKRLKQNEEITKNTMRNVYGKRTVFTSKL